MRGLFVGIKKICPQAKLPLVGLRGRENPGEQQVGTGMCRGWLGTGQHSQGPGMPELCVSWLGLEQPWEPPAPRFLKAFRFLFCLRSKVFVPFHEAASLFSTREG